MNPETQVAENKPERWWIPILMVSLVYAADLFTGILVFLYTADIDALLAIWIIALILSCMAWQVSHALGAILVIVTVFLALGFVALLFLSIAECGANDC